MARVSIEDCQKMLPNRFALVAVAANRARQLMGNSQPLVKTRNKEAVTALREIAEGKVVMKGVPPALVEGDASTAPVHSTPDPLDFLT
jgi:DNA-directed RNA polymerase subunit omega